MRGLAEDHAAALRGVELFRTARAIEKVGEIERADHARPAVSAAFNDVARAQNRRIEAVAVADHQHDPGLLRRLDHRAAFGNRNRHRLFDQHMFSALGRELHMRGMMLVRRRDIDDLDIRIGAEFFDGRVSPRAELGCEQRSSFRQRIGAGDQTNARVIRERRHHDGESAAQTRDTHPQLPRAHRLTCRSRGRRSARARRRS